jgi:CheY-like chemotaxis protein
MGNDARVERNAPRPRPARGLRVVIADDNADGRDMLAFLLQHAGYDVATAADGVHALQVAAEFDPQAVVLDIGMPGMNGYDVARRLRQGADGSRLLLVALSGLGERDDKERAVEAGFDHHFTKPVDAGALLDWLADRLPRPRA